ncbi:peroxiredoxin family protein [Megalodesulfovibrio paquesii]
MNAICHAFRFLPVVVVLVCSLASPAPAQAQAIAGETLPSLILPGPLTAKDAATLGVPQDQPFALERIGTPFLLLQLFSMYCPHCQREAPQMNTLHATIVKHGLDKKITILGVGIGNSPFEVNIFREKFALSFPLVPDKELKSYTAVGSVGTPYYVFCAKDAAGWKVLYEQEGTFENPDDFLALLLRRAGLPALR